ncbi:FAD-binding oxidoreductase [Nitriliruptoraceae bacterium ZYF776]|nr:FAD-binding oxidoreductase [Profundirhabdus halotolerans]
MTATTPPPAPPADLVARLRDQVFGAVLTPADEGFDRAHRPYYGGFDDLRPAVVVRPSDASDVATVVRVAAEAALPLAVRSGGHGLAGYGTVHDGIVLDLSSLDDLALDPTTRTAWTGAGVTTGRYTAAADAHGLATGFGDAPTVGIGGLTVGGGLGFLSRRDGLTIDSLLAAEVVTADGVVRTVDAEHEPDLFWGIRGGGGNLGVVTRLRFALHDVREVTGGLLVLPAAPDVLAGVVRVATEAPDALSLMANTMVAPPLPFLPPSLHGQLITMLVVAHAGPRADAERDLTPLRALADPLVDELGPIPYSALFEGGPPADAHPAAVTRTMYRSGFATGDAAAALDGLRRSSADMAVVQLRPLGGAIARIASDATAYAHREQALMVNVAAMTMDPAAIGEHTAWADALAADLHEPGNDGAYVNFLGDEGPDRVRAAYPGPTGDRLRALKRRYDPTNLFSRNQNVPPDRAALHDGSPDRIAARADRP